MVLNHALAAETEAWYNQQEQVGYAQTSVILRQWKKLKKLQFLHEVSSVPLQQDLRHPQTAFTNFFAGRATYSHFKKKLSDAAWDKLVEQLASKAKWYGQTSVKINQWFPSSKRYGYCGHIVEKLSLNIREWNCPNDGMHHDGDINASQNILAAEQQ